MFASMALGNDGTREKEVGGVVEKVGHGELGARRRSVAMAATTTTTHNTALPLLEWWC